MASLLWGQRLVHEVCRAKGVEHASALACCLESHAARSEDFDPVPCLLQLIAKEATARIAANALCGWLSNVPAARAAFRDLRRLGPFLAGTTDMAICQAASCVLRDAACAIPNGDAGSLIGPLAALCDRALPAHDPAGLCQGRIARHTLLQFSYFGLLEERCLSEKLFEAQFGLRFSSSQGAPQP